MLHPEGAASSIKQLLSTKIPMRAQGDHSCTRSTPILHQDDFKLTIQNLDIIRVLFINNEREITMYITIKDIDKNE